MLQNSLGLVLNLLKILIIRAIVKIFSTILEILAILYFVWVISNI